MAAPWRRRQKYAWKPRTKSSKANESNEAQEKQNRVEKSSATTVAKRKIEGNSFDLPIKKRLRANNPFPAPAPTPKEPYWHAPGITRTELMPKLLNSTYIYLNEGDYTIGTQQLQEMRLMFHKWVSKHGIIKADRWGYYVIFWDTTQTLETARKCFEAFRFQRFEDAIMPMMLFHKGECVARCHLDKEEFDEEDFVWVGDALLKSLS